MWVSDSAARLCCKVLLAARDCRHLEVLTGHIAEMNPIRSLRSWKVYIAEVVVGAN